jgi:hypothetical protein
MPKVICDALRVVQSASACCKTSLRNFSGNALGVRMDTGTPSNCSASCLNAASVNRLVVSTGSTSKWRSHSSSSVPVKTEPKMRARRVVAAYDKALAEGVGAVTVDGKMIDVPVVERARLLLEREAAIAAREEKTRALAAPPA